MFSALAAVGALTLPAANASMLREKEGVDGGFEGVALPAVSVDRRSGDIFGQDPQKVTPPCEQTPAELRQRLAVSEATLSASLAENKLLRSAQESFIRLNSLGTPMEREAALRHTVDDRLRSIEAAMAQPVSNEVRRIYVATIDGLFSDIVIGRDKDALDELLRKELPQATPDERKTHLASFVDSMVSWRGFLKRDEMIQRLHASTHGMSVAMVPGLPESAATFLVSPTPPEVTISAAVSSEYVAAKACALKLMLEQSRQKDAGPLPGDRSDRE